MVTWKPESELFIKGLPFLRNCEATFSLKSGLQKGPRKLKIKNLQWIKMLKDATKN